MRAQGRFLMDDFQHRLLVALERLAGREGSPAVGLVAALEQVVSGQALVVSRLAQIRERLEDIRDRLPPAGP
jgi:hypothetical protein